MMSERIRQRTRANQHASNFSDKKFPAAIQVNSHYGM